MGEIDENLALQSITFILASYFTCRKILRHGASGFPSSPKENVLRIFTSLKNPLLLTGLKLQILGTMASTLTITPPRRLHTILLHDGRAMAQAIISRALNAESWFAPGSVHVRFVVDKVALGQVFLRVIPLRLRTHISSGG
jgi:hypothetical protein